MYVDPHEISDFSKQRQQDLIAWRENERLVKSLPHRESADRSSLRQMVTAIIRRLETPGESGRAPAQPHVRRRV
ncbi:MAG: hypothetical protein K8J31_14910 [Anaerolineae bacterium]|nr:hypothetical protein [Anaerolineae bacterium]